MINDHSQMNELLPLYVAKTLDENQCSALELHLNQCSICRADLAFWQAISTEVAAVDRKVTAPAKLVETALSKVARPVKGDSLFRHAFQILRGQIPLVQRELWLASALVMAIGLIMAVLAQKAVVIHVLAPMVATVCVVIIYGTENDPALELTIATPTSQWQILLARLALVFTYNLVLALVASLSFTWLVPGEVLGSLILGWLGPMAFLSALALVISLWASAANAITIAYLSWLLQLISGYLIKNATLFQRLMPSIWQALETYLNFWSNPGLLLIGAVLLCAAALWLVSHFGLMPRKA